MNVPQANDALTKATRAVADATQDLADTREAVSFGEMTERDVSLAQRALDRATAKEAQAKTDLAVATRAQLAEEARRKAESDRIAGQLRAIAFAQGREEVEKLKLWIHAVAAEAVRVDRAILEFDHRAGDHALLVPSSLRCYRELLALLPEVVLALDPIKLAPPPEGM